MADYAKQFPKDRTNQLVVGAPPAFITLQSQIGNPVASSVITLSSMTTVVGMSAIGGTIIGKWGVASVTSNNFDVMVSPNTGTQMFVVPVSVMGTGSIVGANVQNGLYPAISVKQATSSIATVLTIEY